VRAQIGGGKPDLLSQTVAVNDRSENRVVAAEHFAGGREIAVLNGLPDRSAAHDCAIYFNRRNSDDLEIEFRSERFQQIKIAAPIFTEGSFVADTNFPQWLCMGHKCSHEIFRFDGRELFVEINNEEGPDAEIANQRDLMLR